MELEAQNSRLFSPRAFWTACGLALCFSLVGTEAGSTSGAGLEEPSGLRLMVEPRPGSPIVAGVLGFAVGACDEPADRPRLRDVLLAALSAPDGPGGRAARRMEALGGALSFEVGDEAVFIQAVLPTSATSPRHARGLSLSEAAEPRPDLQALLDALVAGAGLDSSRTPEPEPGRVASFVASSLGPQGRVYWALREAIQRGTPFAISTAAAPETAARTSALELEGFRRHYFVGRRAFLAVVGRVTATEVREAVSARFGSLPLGSRPSGQRPSPSPWFGRMVVAVPSHTAWVAFGYLGPPGGTAAADHLEELARRIGEGNTSLLYGALRQEAGLTYWTGVTWEEGITASLAIFWAECAPENVERVEGKMRRVLSNPLPARLQWNAERTIDRRASRRLMDRQRALSGARTLVQEGIAENIRRCRGALDDGAGVDPSILTLTPERIGSPVVVVGMPEEQRDEAGGSQ